MIERTKLIQRITEASEKEAEIVLKEVEETSAAEAKQKINKRLLARRKKYAETEVVASEMGMTLEQIREFNAYSDGYNARAIELRNELFDKPIVKEEPLEEEVKENEVAPVVEEETTPAPEPIPEEVVPEPIPEEVVPEPIPEEVLVEPTPAEETKA